MFYLFIEREWHSKSSLLKHSPLPCGHAVEQVAEALGYKRDGREFDSRWCHWGFWFTYSYRPHNGTGVDAASNRNEYQEYFLGVKTTVP